MKKFEGIDLLKLYTSGSYKGWNEYLDNCVRTRNINSLAKLRYQLQVGMSDLAKNKLNDEKIDIWFVRLIKSIEKTAKHILRIKHPMPGDNSATAKAHPGWLEIKRKRDLELAIFFKNSSY